MLLDPLRLARHRSAQQGAACFDFCHQKRQTMVQKEVPWQSGMVQLVYLQADRLGHEVRKMVHLSEWLASS